MAWADFWNVEAFPGKRSLPDNPSITLPLALLADGIPIDKIYPIDLDRAFASLKKIRPHVSVWWTSAGQSVQVLQDKEVVYGASYNGRVFGKPDIDYTYKQGYLELSWFGVPKGTSPQQKAEVMKFFHELTVAQNQVVFMNLLPYFGIQFGIWISCCLPRSVRCTRLLQGTRNCSSPPMPPSGRRSLWRARKRWQQFKLGISNLAELVQRLRGWGYVLPLLVFVVVAFDAPVIRMLSISMEGPAGPLGGFRELIQTPAYLGVLVKTFELALATAILCGVLGYLLAYWIYTVKKSTRLRMAVLALVHLYHSGSRAEFLVELTPGSWCSATTASSTDCCSVPVRFRNHCH